MKPLKKIGIALGIAVLLAAACCFLIFHYIGPRVTLERIKLLNEPARYERALEVGEQFLLGLKENDIIYHPDARGVSVSVALLPVPYSYITVVEKRLIIECGGGLYHFGYEVNEEYEGSYSISFYEEETEPKKLKTTEPNQAPETTILTVTDRAPSSTLRASEDRVSP